MEIKSQTLKLKPKRKVNTISKLIIALSQGLLGRANLTNLIHQIHIKQKSIIKFIKERRTIKVLHVFRNYSAFIVVLSSALLVSATNLAAGRDSSGFLFGYFGSNDNYENPLADKISIQANKKNDLALVQLAQASTAPDPNAKDESGEELMTQGQALVALTSPIKKDPEEDGGVTMYEVQAGDTISSIAAKNSITVNTILWANELDDINSIMPGDKIFILPVAGLAYTVQKDDTIDNIASKYKANKEKIIAFNDLPANGELKEGQELIIPEGQKETISPRPSAPASTTQNTGIIARQYDSFETIGKKLEGKAGTGHIFPYGYCTWYVAQKRYVPWSGNAGTWLYKAKSLGYATGRTPRVGSIMVTTENRYYGHVALVERVNGNMITVSEMNYQGWAKKSVRTLDYRSRVVKGFIY